MVIRPDVVNTRYHFNVRSLKRTFRRASHTPNVSNVTRALTNFQAQMDGFDKHIQQQYYALLSYYASLNNIISSAKYTTNQIKLLHNACSALKGDVIHVKKQLLKQSAIAQNFDSQLNSLIYSLSADVVSGLSVTLLEAFDFKLSSGFSFGHFDDLELKIEAIKTKIAQQLFRAPRNFFSSLRNIFYLGLFLTLLGSPFSLFFLNELFLLIRLYPYFTTIFPLFRSCFIFCILFWFWGGMHWVFKQYRVKFRQIIESSKKTSMNFLKSFKLAAILSTVWLLCFYGFILSLRKAIPVDPSVFAIIVFVTYFLIFFSPFGFYTAARNELFSTFFNCLIAPFGRIGFKEFFFADVMTSLVKVFVDLQFSFCIVISAVFNYSTRVTMDSFDVLIANHTCDDVSKVLSPVLLLFPYWVRFFHCIRKLIQIRPTSVRAYHPNLTNAVKYSISMAANVLSILSSRHGHLNSTLWYWFLATQVTASIYTSMFDLCVDWGFLDNLEDFANQWLRKRLCYPRWFYYLAVVMNLALRFIWILFSFSTYIYIYPDELILIQESVEIFRRCMWACFRVEKEEASKPIGFVCESELLVNHDYE
ncbi:hypothetical protein GEMRC1_009795 [Eukaryota sp. GEM-RC1]